MSPNANEKIKELEDENKALKHRRKVFTQGTMCFFCPMNCDSRVEKYRGEISQK